MAKRKIVEIDRDLCDGCGLCTKACAEGALALDDENKAVLVREIYCDGMGACLDVCPTGALKIVERESADYNPQAAYDHVLRTRGREAARRVHGVEDTDGHHPPRFAGRQRTSISAGCPGSAACEIPEPGEGRRYGAKTVPGGSELRQWPIQLQLASPFAPYFKDADLLIAADCTAFSLGSFHADLLRGKKLVIACPKLDETEAYAEKIAAIIRQNTPRSLTVAIMTVPCCSGLWHIVEQAVDMTGLPVRAEKRIIHIDGRLIS